MLLCSFITGLEEQLPDFIVHPRVSTVTYLSDIGAPTLILNKHSPPPSDKDKSSINGSINKAWLSHPNFGKHVAFDGRFLHGAPAEFFPSVKKPINAHEPQAKKLKVERSSAGGKRITFLVNVWLNHCPLESEPLDDELVDKLTTPWEDMEENANAKGNLKVGDSTTPPSFRWKVSDIAVPDNLTKTATLRVSKGGVPAGIEECILCNRHVDMTYGASMEEYHYVSKLAAEEGSMPIHLGDGVCTLSVGKEVSSDEDEDTDS